RVAAECRARIEEKICQRHEQLASGLGDDALLHSLVELRDADLAAAEGIVEESLGAGAVIVSATGGVVGHRSACRRQELFADTPGSCAASCGLRLQYSALAAEKCPLWGTGRGCKPCPIPNRAVAPSPHRSRPRSSSTY